jgi:hypothetical protein
VIDNEARPPAIPPIGMPVNQRQERVTHLLEVKTISILGKRHHEDREGESESGVTGEHWLGGCGEDDVV